MISCPYCGAGLTAPASRQASRASTSTGGKSKQSELVKCPQCDGVIDGYATH